MQEAQKNLSEKGALCVAIRAAISPGFRAMNAAMEKAYGPKALGYKEPKDMDRYKGPKEHRAKVAFRERWYHEIVRNMALGLADLEEDAFSRRLMRKRLERLAGLKEDGPQYTADAGLPQKARESMRQGAKDAISILDEYEAPACNDEVSLAAE